LKKLINGLGSLFTRNSRVIARVAFLIRTFFSYGLIQDQYLRKSEVYAKLREKWRDTKDQELIVKELAECQDAFLDVACGTNLQLHKKDVYQAFRLLYKSGAPDSTYPFTMQLSNAIKNGLVQEGDGIEVLDLIESFLVRRAICGHEPTRSI
jgi:hypothetical protein